MKQIQWIAVVVVTATMGLVGTARAAMYAYARQQTSNFQFAGATIGAKVNHTSTSASTDFGGPASFNGFEDAAQSFRTFLGGGAPPENTFTAFGAANDDYVRGDALISGPFATNNVAESRLANLVNSAGAGSWISTIPLTVATAGAVTTSFNYLNEITLGHDGSGDGISSTQASYSWNLSIRNAAGAIVFNSSPSALNLSVGLTSAGTFNQPGSGTVAVTTGTLSPGSYSMTLSGTETVFIFNNAGVPEPASMGAIACAFIALARRRSRR